MEHIGTEFASLLHQVDVQTRLQNEKHHFRDVARGWTSERMHARRTMKIVFATMSAVGLIAWNHANL